MQITRQLALAQEDEREADHLQAAGRLLTDQKRRSLVVWITDLAETAMTPEVMEAAFQLMPRHLVLFVVIGQPDLSTLGARKPEDAARCTKSRPRRKLCTAENFCWRGCASVAPWHSKPPPANFPPLS